MTVFFRFRLSALKIACLQQPIINIYANLARTNNVANPNSKAVTIKMLRSNLATKGGGNGTKKVLKIGLLRTKEVSVEQKRCSGEVENKQRKSDV